MSAGERSGCSCPWLQAGAWLASSPPPSPGQAGLPVGAHTAARGGLGGPQRTQVEAPPSGNGRGLPAQDLPPPRTPPARCSTESSSPWQTETTHTFRQRRLRADVTCQALSSPRRGVPGNVDRRGFRSPCRSPPRPPGPLPAVDSGHPPQSSPGGLPAGDTVKAPRSDGARSPLKQASDTAAAVLWLTSLTRVSSGHGGPSQYLNVLFSMKNISSEPA